MQAVIHLSDVDRADRAFGNASTLLGPGANIEDVAIVANASGVRAFRTDAGHGDRITHLIESGLIVRACRNSLLRNDIGPAALVDGVETVPAGVVHLTHLQDLGWSYLRP